MALLSMRASRGALFWMTVLNAACASQGPVPLRLEPIPYSDTLPIQEPAKREAIEVARLIDASVSGEVTNVISVRKAAGAVRNALNVTHFDDVVNSAWFEHRNGRVRMSPQEVWRGPTTEAGPDTRRTLTVVGGKAQGISPGFTVRDARGHRYLVKFDPKGFLHLASAAGVISNRLFYAAGYHTPEDYIVAFDSARLELDPEAEITLQDGTERRMTRQDVQAVLALVDPLPDGRYFALASRFVPGIPKGPFYFEGVRDDDPNDHYHHEFRRELRGLKVVSAWLNHVDMRFANTLDAYVAPGYLRHYLIDFAATLGSGTIRPHDPREGQEYNFDFWPSMGRMFTLGFFRMGWEEEPFEIIDPSIGWMAVEEFDPGKWKPNWPNEAFSSVKVADGYWGAKLVGSFSEDQIRAAVSAGALPRQFAADTLARILSYRRDRVVEYWYAKVSPLENPEATRGSNDGAGFTLAFEDYGIKDGAWSAEGVSYQWELQHGALDRAWHGEQAAVPGSARQTITVAPDQPTSRAVGADQNLSERDAIAVLQVTVKRDGGRGSRRPARVSLRWEGNGYQVVGLRH